MFIESRPCNFKVFSNHFWESSDKYKLVHICLKKYLCRNNRKRKVLHIMLNEMFFPQLICRANKPLKYITEGFSKSTKSVLSKCYKG